MKGKIIEKNGKEYLKLENPVLKVEKFLVHRVYLHNLFQDNPEMTERVNQLLTENIMTYEEEIIPILERFFIGIFENPFRETFDYFSLDELFD